MTAARDDRSLAGGPLGRSRAMGAGHAGRDDAPRADARYGTRSEPDGYETSSGPLPHPLDGGRPAGPDEPESVFDIADDHRDGPYRSYPPSTPGHDRTGSYRSASEGSSMTYPPGPPSGARAPYPGSAPAAAPPPPFAGGRHSGSSSGSGPFGPIPTAPATSPMSGRAPRPSAFPGRSGTCSTAWA